MIAGMVNAVLEPNVTLVVFDANGHQHAIEAIVDTGFNGELTLPGHLIASLGLTWKACSGGFLADGSYIDFDVYSAKVWWDGVTRVVDIEATNGSTLLGTELLRDRGLHVEFKPGGLVRIDALP